MKLPNGGVIPSRNMRTRPPKPKINHSYDTFESKWKSCRFAVYIIKQLAEAWNCSHLQVIEQLNEINSIEDDLIYFYEVLHTQDTLYVIDSLERQIERQNKWILKK